MSYSLGIGECIAHVRNAHNGNGMEMLVDNRSVARRNAIELARQIYVPDPADDSVETMNTDEIWERRIYISTWNEFGTISILTIIDKWSNSIDILMFRIDKMTNV